ncbi:hypothetical protein HYALB_00006497 [Hymenoscyphus albidus]|uniref:Major facilitator superfamily (MFS) profile domain-containing protein n=1 Tax=Hymenoscyphus albidus TaxID=595503 RepID=A0A9N9LNN6_9HELO|nr:hypothetical protein HYALB_00006497 [Hymenoscyphus albidus]
MASQASPEVVDEKVTNSTTVPANDHPFENKETLARHQPISNASSTEDVSPDAQEGVKDVEAITMTWSRTHLYMAYIFLWIIYFVDAMNSGVTGALTPYVTSSFQRHSLTATTSIMSSIIGGLWKLPLAKILDLWGRPQGFLMMSMVLTLGLIMMAACNNVQTYAAAQVFYWTGYNGLTYTMSIFIADTSALKSRAFAFAFVSSPYIATAWIGGPIAQNFLSGAGFRWGFGTFAIVTPIMTMPLFLLLWWNQNKAKKTGLIQQRNSGRTTFESLKHYAIEFDVIGVLLLCAGLALFLLPFSLYSYQPLGWKAPMIICMIIFGGVLLGVFAVYEKYFAPVAYIDYSLLTDRTVFGACILSGVLFVEFYIWDSYFPSFLQVVNGLNVTETSYIVNIYSIGSCFFSLIVGILVRITGRFKWLALYFGVPFTILGVGLMIAFRQPDQNIGYIIMCQIFIAFSGGTLVICEQMAAMAAASHQQVATVIAVEGMFASVGGAIGSTVAAAIWTGVFPKQLAKNLPTEALPELTTIYGSLTTQLSYPIGNATRTAIIESYGETQKLMLIASTAVLVLAIGSVMMWRDINVKDLKQVKGVVF